MTLVAFPAILPDGTRWAGETVTIRLNTGAKHRPGFTADHLVGDVWAGVMPHDGDLKVDLVPNVGPMAGTRWDIEVGVRRWSIKIGDDQKDQEGGWLAFDPAILTTQPPTVSYVPGPPGPAGDAQPLRPTGTPYRAPHLDGWMDALAASPTDTADIVWIGDSLSELGTFGPSMPWVVQQSLTSWTEGDRNGGFYQGHSPFSGKAVVSTGSDSDEGFGRRSTLLEEGDTATIPAQRIRGISLLYRRAPGAGSLQVAYTGSPATIDAAGALAHSQLWTSGALEVPTLSADVVITAVGGPVLLEGVMLHASNRTRGVRVWPAARSGARSDEFADVPGRVLDAISSIGPDLVVIATGTNDAGNTNQDLMEERLRGLITAVRGRHSGDIALWIPYVQDAWVAADASRARAIAADLGLAVIDASVLAPDAATADGIHMAAPTAPTLGMHAAAVLSGDPIGTLVRHTAYARDFRAWLATAAQTQTWTPGGGSIRHGALPGGPAISLFGAGPEAEVTIISQATASLIGMPGATLALGPGSAPGDTAISRAGAGHVAVQAGDGTLSAGRLRLKALDDPPAGPNVIGDIAVIDGVVQVCTAAGSPGSWTVIGTQT